MAKKTKKEKILAEQRRKAQFSLRLPSSMSPAKKENLALFQPKEEGVQTPSLYIYPVQLIRKDLTKTLLLSILAISLELALFWILEKHLVLPLGIKL